MKTIYSIAITALLTVSSMFAQDVTTVRANNSDISDNLDLKAVASIFGDSKDLEDFERRLNDPGVQISNLDLNRDGRVDYLRVIEAVEGNTHLIILQSVLGADTFQDVATVEVERDRNNNVQVQVVGNTYMYGSNYIYEPVYVHRPIIWDVFWVSSYRPYYSPWYWGYYPSYYSYWAPYPIYRYRNNIHVHINNYNTYNYVNVRRSNRAVSLYNTRRANSYERANPNNNFTRRTNATNRYALEQTRATSSGSRSQGTAAVRSNNTGTRTLSAGTRATSADNNTRSVNSVRSEGIRPTRSAGGNEASLNNNTRTQTVSTPSRSQSVSTPPRQSMSTPSRSNEAVRTRSFDNSAVRSNPANTVRSSSPAPQRQSTPAMRTMEPSRSAAPAMRSSSPAPQRQNAPAQSQSRGGGGNTGGRRG
ncbi:MAG: hypothetical protein ACO1N9_10535 [Flavobacterium sp.]